MALDRALRLRRRADLCADDNERTVSVDHICGVAVRKPQIVSVARHYGLTIATCVPADPQSKGGSEATVRIAKADLVPTDHNLRGDYEHFAQLERACVEFGDRVNAREHRITRRPPAVMLAEERARSHRLPDMPHTVCFGQTRRVSGPVDVTLMSWNDAAANGLPKTRAAARKASDDWVDCELVDLRPRGAAQRWSGVPRSGSVTSIAGQRWAA
jgi:hypothetical protein